MDPPEMDLEDDFSMFSYFSGLGNWMKLDFGGFMLVSTQFSVQTMFDTWFYPPPKDFVGLLRLQFALRGLKSSTCVPQDQSLGTELSQERGRLKRS